jgi:hypothetical protein
MRRFGFTHLFLLKFVCALLIVLAGSVQVFAQTKKKIAVTYGNGAGASHSAVINDDGSGPGGRLRSR